MERIKEKKQLLTDKEIRSILPVAGLTVCAILILAVSTDTFLSRQNLLNLFSKAASSQVMALGMALVLLSGYFDLTGGAVVVLQYTSSTYFSVRNRNSMGTCCRNSTGSAQRYFCCLLEDAVSVNIFGSDTDFSGIGF